MNRIDFSLKSNICIVFMANFEQVINSRDHQTIIRRNFCQFPILFRIVDWHKPLKKWLQSKIIFFISLQSFKALVTFSWLIISLSVIANFSCYTSCYEALVVFYYTFKNDVLVEINVENIYSCKMYLSQSLNEFNFQSM